MRSVSEWIGKTDDQKVPDRVRMRVFDREGGICHLTGEKIDPVRDEWDLDHKVALILGGEHRETNLFPAKREPHRRKTAVEMKVKSKIARTRKKHLGIAKPKSSLSHPRFKRCMDGTVVDRRTGEVIR
ncbi:HNH endonuclease [Sinorhizobium sp. LM21]|uniref:HNH endonuclease n=1 Tax=Sinorhizobium phage phiLM21 TaxID=1524882 RepID=UPI0004E5D733|nr:HNH endonuclease [Sinorhizobium phage phiLM21]AII27756.1 HNH endonuclease [Sinorhizobium phage phiLM21]OWZ93521.1 HNH endonuclease [Sinorhizobium sp. LM21]